MVSTVDVLDIIELIREEYSEDIALWLRNYLEEFDYDYWEHEAEIEQEVLELTDEINRLTKQVECYKKFNRLP